MVIIGGPHDTLLRRPRCQPGTNPMPLQAFRVGPGDGQTRPKKRVLGEITPISWDINPSLYRLYLWHPMAIADSVDLHPQVVEMASIRCGWIKHTQLPTCATRFSRVYFLDWFHQLICTLSIFKWMHSHQLLRKQHFLKDAHGPFLYKSGTLLSNDWPSGLRCYSCHGFSATAGPNPCKERSKKISPQKKASLI